MSFITGTVEKLSNPLRANSRISGVLNQERCDRLIGSISYHDLLPIGVGLVLISDSSCPTLNGLTSAFAMIATHTIRVRAGWSGVGGGNGTLEAAIERVKQSRATNSG